MLKVGVKADDVARSILESVVNSSLQGCALAKVDRVPQNLGTAARARMAVRSEEQSSTTAMFPQKQHNPEKTC
jgi:hypothetical protein